MSSIPNANRSVITNLQIVPDSFHSYPRFDRSNIQSSKFVNLNPSTLIERSRLVDVHLSADTRQSDDRPRVDRSRSKIERSDVINTDLEQVEVERCQISKSCLRYARAQRSSFSKVKLTGSSTRAEVQVERCRLANSEVAGRSSLSRTTIADTLVRNVTLDRATIASSHITQSKIDSSSISSCDIADCKIQSTNFSNKFVRNGIWDRGTLVGRVDPTREVIVKDLSEMRPVEVPPRQLDVPRGILRQTSSYGSQPEGSHPVQDYVAGTERQASFQDEKPPLQHLDSHLSSLDRYDGPDLDSLPPYQA